MKKLLPLLIATIFLLSNCMIMNKNPENNAPQEVVDFDHKFAGASVLEIDGHVLTSSGIFEADNDGKMAPCVKIKVDKGDRERYFAGDEIVLGVEKTVKVVQIDMPETESGKGQVYLKNK